MPKKIYFMHFSVFKTKYLFFRGFYCFTCLSLPVCVKSLILFIFQVIINKLWFGDNIAQAIYRPRFCFNINFPNTVLADETNNQIFKEVITQLRNRSDVLIKPEEMSEYSAVHGIYVDDNGDINAKTDYRKHNHTDGF